MNEIQDMFCAPCISEPVTQKSCPFCAEKIQAEAIKCRYCGEFLTDSGARAPQGKRPISGIKWYHTTGSVIAALVCLGPLALPMVWTNPRFKIATKLILTLVVSVVTVLCLHFMVEAIMYPLKQLEALR